MIPQISLKTDGLFDTSKFQAWTSRAQEKIRRGVRQAFVAGGKEIADAANAELRSKFNVKKKQFGTAFKVKVYAQKRDRLPAMMIGSKVPWLGIFQRGGVVRGKGGGLLIPLLDKRIGPKAFKKIVDALLKSGNAFFKQVNGKLILFAVHMPEMGRSLGRFRRMERKRRGGKNPQDGWTGEIIPIAVMVPQVRLTKRFDLEQIVRRHLPALIRKVESHISS